MMDLTVSVDRAFIEIPVTFSITSIEKLDDGNVKMTGEMQTEFERPSLERRPCELIVAQDGDSYRLISVTINPECDSK